VFGNVLITDQQTVNKILFIIIPNSSTHGR